MGGARRVVVAIRRGSGADGSAGEAGVDTDEVRKWVDEQESPDAELRGMGRASTDQGIVRLSAVVDLPDDPVAPGPDP